VPEIGVVRRAHRKGQGDTQRQCQFVGILQDTTVADPTMGDDVVWKGPGRSHSSPRPDPPLHDTDLPIRRVFRRAGRLVARRVGHQQDAFKGTARLNERDNASSKEMPRMTTARTCSARKLCTPWR